MKFEHETKQISLKLNTTAKHLDCASFHDEAEEVFHALYKRNLGNFIGLYHAIQRVAKRKQIDIEKTNKLLNEVGRLDDDANRIE